MKWFVCLVAMLGLMAAVGCKKDEKKTAAPENVAPMVQTVLNTAF